MILSTETKADIRRLHDIWLARLAFEYRCEQTDVLAAIEPRRADAPGAQTVPLSGAQSSLAGGGAVAIPATHSPETADDIDGSADGRARHEGTEPTPAELEVSSPLAGDQAEPVAGTQAPPVDTALPPRAPEKAADAPPAGEPSPHVSPAPNQNQPPLQPVRPERPTSVPAKRPAAIVVPPAGKVTTILDRVRVVHQQHPTWTASMIAKHLGANANSVSTLLATVRRQERGEQAPPPPAIKPEFEGRAELLEHYHGVGKRLGKVR